MGYPDDITKAAESIVEQCKFWTPTHYLQVKEFAARTLMAERERCAMIAREKFPHAGQAKMRRAGALIAEDILGDD